MNDGDKRDIIRTAIRPVLREVEDIMVGDGARKHGLLGWLAGRSLTEDVEHAKGHIDNWEQGDDEDPDSGHSPLSHAITRLVTARSQEIEGVGEDDRGGLPPAKPCPNCAAAEQRAEEAWDSVANLSEDVRQMSIALSKLEHVLSGERERADHLAEALRECAVQHHARKDKWVCDLCGAEWPDNGCSHNPADHFGGCPLAALSGTPPEPPPLSEEESTMVGGPDEDPGHPDDPCEHGTEGAGRDPMVCSACAHDRDDPLAGRWRRLGEACRRELGVPSDRVRVVADPAVIRVPADAYSYVRATVGEALRYGYDRKAYKHEVSPLTEEEADRLLDCLEDEVMNGLSEGLVFPDPDGV